LAVRYARSQIDAVVRARPGNRRHQILTAAVIVVGFRDTTDNFQLGLWFGAACADLLHARRSGGPASPRPRICRTASGSYGNDLPVGFDLAAMWTIPPIIWFDTAEPGAEDFPVRGHGGL
jgi:hypothetical protein